MGSGRPIVTTSLALVFAGLLWPGCSSTRPTLPPVPGNATLTVAWQCGDRTVTLVSEARDRMRMTVGDESFDLYPVPAASGAKYEAAGDPSTVFWTKGERALLELRGERAPECLPLAPSTAMLTARGNEPGWRLDLDAVRLVLLLDHGARRLEAPAPAAESVAGGRRYRATTTDGPLVVTVQDARCVDSMTGMPYPFTVTLTLRDRSLTGCGGEADTLLRGREWRVVEIDGRPPVAGSRATLRFGNDGRLTGHASCNRYTATYRLTGEELRIDAPVTTRMACPGPVMEQESRFLSVLTATRGFAVPEDDTLVLDAGTAGRIVARRR